MAEYCAIVELARVEESEAVRWIGEYGTTREVKIEADAARELVDALGGDMMMVSNELEKLILYVGEKKRITLGDVETMVLAAKQRSLYELTDAISSKDRVRALQMLDAILSTGDGDEAAIGHLYMLAKTFRQMLVILERNVRDQRMLWAALWQGFRVPPFAADDIIRQARRYKSKRELTRAIRLVAKTDLALRSNPPSKRFVLEKLILDLTAEAKPEIPDGHRKNCRSRTVQAQMIAAKEVMTERSLSPPGCSSLDRIRHLLDRRRDQNPRHPFKLSLSPLDTPFS